MYRFVLFTGAFLGLIQIAHSQPSNLVSYQGYAEDGGTPVSGSHSLTIALYTAPVGGTIVYVEEHPPILFQDGAFGIALGSGNANGANPHAWDGLDFSVPYWISVDIDDTTLDPRTPLLAVPHARSLVAPALITGQVSGGNTVSVTNTATSGYSIGVFGDSDSPFGTGVSGRGSNRGVFGETVATTGTAWGVQGVSASTTGRGVLGNATATTGETFGVAGASDSNSGRGVYGHATSTSGPAYGVLGRTESSSGRGVSGLAVATSGYAYGVYGESAAPSGGGVEGKATSPSGYTYGIRGRSISSNGVGVFGDASAPSGYTYGVQGQSQSTEGSGIRGVVTADSPDAHAVLAIATGPDAYAGWFSGRVKVTGVLSKAGGSFEIDHPLEPERRILRHSFVESPDMMNVYNGNATLGPSGSATVPLPAYFEALNRDFRYQLTALGAPGPNLYVADEVRGGQFRIAGGAPGMLVSWQVTGIRQDAWANQNRIVVEEDKRSDHIGRYLNPDAFGLGRERSVDYEAIQSNPQAAEGPRTDAERRLGEEERIRNATAIDDSASEQEGRRDEPRPPDRTGANSD